MGGHGRSSGQDRRRQRDRSSGDGMGGGTQTDHNPWHTVDDIQSQLGVSRQEAQDFYDAVNGGYEGGFTRGWDWVMRARQQGLGDDEIMSHHDNEYGTIQDRVDDLYGGDKNAYYKAVDKKASDLERLIDRAPKWDGGELTRGFSDLDDAHFAALTDPNGWINLNAGSASWTTDPFTSDVFAGRDSAFNNTHALVAHVSGIRRATSIDGLSHYSGQYSKYGAGEWEVVASKREAFELERLEHRDGKTHAYYRLVDTDYDWYA